MGVFAELNKPHSVLAIGNGFDLNIKLKSSFSQFLKCKLMNNDRVSADACHENIWYQIFAFTFFVKSDEAYIKRIEQTDPKWMDIESLIAILTKGITGMGQTKTALSDIWRLRILDLPYAVNGIYKENVIYEQLKELQAALKYTGAKKYHDIFDFFLAELKRFETDFSEYLANELNKQPGYQEEVDRRMEVFYDRLGNNQLFVLNFNYTEGIDRSPFVAEEVHIHGSLSEGNIIIGTGEPVLDEVDLKGAEEFTKAKRRLDLDRSLKLPNPEEIDFLAFYGLSLGEEDYPTFFSLLDHYLFDRIDGKTKLRFFYSDNKRRKETLDNTYRLLTQYARTKGGSEMGKGILTRLLNSNRIAIEEVNF